jgi:MFS family permease
MSAEMTETNSARQIRLVLAGVLLAMLLAMLDNAIVGTAMPTIVRELGGLSQVAWVVTAYTLLSAISTPVWAKLGDLYSRKAIFLSAIGVFLIGSVLAGASWSMPALIGFRAVQGLGAGGIAVTAFAVIGALVPPRERGKYQGMTATAMAVGTIGGPLLGGVITDGLDWRWAFYINIPLGLVAFAWSWWRLELPVVRRKVTIDYAGILALTTAIAALVLIATWGGVDYAWLSARIIGRRLGRIPGHRTSGRRSNHSARDLPHPQSHAGGADRTGRRRDHVRLGVVSAAVPADGAGRLGRELRTASAADDDAAAGGLADRREADDRDR